MWTLPKDGLGTVNSETYQAHADYLPVSESRGILYLFVPGNGICAYELVDTSVSGIDDIAGQQLMNIAGNTVSFAEKAQVVVYNVAGTVVANENDVTALQLNVPSGVYIVSAIVAGEHVTEKVVIK